jgi:hypothetical protein
VSQSFGSIPKSGIAESSGRSMFSFLSSLQFFPRVVVLLYIPTSREYTIILNVCALNSRVSNS